VVYFLQFYYSFILVHSSFSNTRRNYFMASMATC
jgi:hypothetical protein